ncbi:MAG: hypothetical protein FWD25_08940 [Clostridia bacterium]|nr:hypothetical protein [Clostridia bacterium]
MYSEIFYTKDEVLEKENLTREDVQTRLLALGCDTPDKQTQYLEEYMGVLYSGFLNGVKLLPEKKRDFMIDDFLDTSWKEMTNKYIMYELRKKPEFSS